jgi:16S rRNA (cytosine967-C5)-methyltransferase
MNKMKFGSGRAKHPTLPQPSKRSMRSAGSRGAGSPGSPRGPASLVDIAVDLARAVMTLEHPSDRVVSDFFRAHRELGSRDRGILAETVFHILRRRRVLQHLVQTGRGDQTRRLVLLAWQGPAPVLERSITPDELQWLAGVRQAPLDALPEAVRSNLPDWMIEPLKASLGEEWLRFATACEESAPLDLRVNLHKARPEAAHQALQAEGFAAEATAYSPWGLRLQGKPALQNASAFKNGEVEVQDEGSQLLALLVDAHRGEMVADFCAGAGGKTLALGASMRNTGRLYAFDTSGHRLAALKPRLARSGLSNVHPVQIAHERDERLKRLAGKIDRVLVDAPCSGLGTLRRNPDLKWRQSPESIVELRERQTAILAGAARLLKPGGRLVYATCSVLPAENEDIAAAFTAAHPDFEPQPVEAELERLKVPQAASLVQGNFLRLWPHRHGIDGFFAAVWTRRA